MAAYGVFFFPRSRPSDPEIVLPIRGPGDTAILPSCVFPGRLFRQGFQRQAGGFCFWFCGAFYFYFVTNSILFFFFWWTWPPICTLSIHCRRAKITRFKRKKKTMFLSLFVMASLHSCQIIVHDCFQFIGQMNSFFNHNNGINVFSCTEPPCGKSGSQWGEPRTRQRLYFFSQWRQKNGTQNIWIERWLDSVCGNSINNVPWGWGWGWGKKKKLFS